MRKQGETGTEQSSESSPTSDELTRPSGQSNFRGKRSTRGAPIRRPGGIRVLVMSDHALTREALCLLIRGQPGIRIVGEAQNDPNDLAAAREKPDVILIDLDSSRHNGFDFISKLTKREREVVALVGAGRKNEQIAEHLSITVTTVRHHLTSIFNKLGVQGRFNLVFFAYENGLASPPRIAPR